jgi:hypothetical protein
MKVCPTCAHSTWRDGYGCTRPGCETTACLVGKAEPIQPGDNKLVVNISAAFPAEDAVRVALFDHLREFAATLEEVGWQAEVTLTVTKDKTDD